MSLFGVSLTPFCTLLLVVTYVRADISLLERMLAEIFSSVNPHL